MSTIVVETRCSIIELAKAYSTIIQETGHRPTSRSEIVRLCVQSICTLYKGEEITEEESLSLLRDALGDVSLGRTREGRVQIGKALRKNLQEQAVESEQEPVTKDALLDKIQKILKEGV